MASKLAVLSLFFTFVSIINISAQDGAAIFRARCASCHIMGKDATGPNLVGALDRWGGNTSQMHQ